MKATRDAYGNALLHLGKTNKNVVVLDSDLCRSTRTEWFKDQYPSRFYNIGIAEANMVGIASGLAETGLIPFITTYAIFISRGFDQIRQSVSYSHKNVKIIASHSGLAASHDGGSHQGIEDISLMRVLPGMTIFSPADYNEAYQAILTAAAIEGPVYVRLQKEPSPVNTPVNKPFDLSQATICKVGKDITFFSTGSLLSKAIEASILLQQEGVEAEVINVSTIKPLDTDTILRSLGKTGCGVAIEEHNSIGGLYESIAALVVSNSPSPLLPVGMPDCFGETGNWNELLDHFGLNTQGIIRAARKSLKLKNMFNGKGEEDAAA